MRIILGVLAAAAMLVAPAASAQQNMAPAATQPVAIRFQPPLNQPVRYRFERTVAQQPASARTSLVVTVEFRQARKGLRMMVAPAFAAPPTATGIPPLQRLEQFLAQPFTLLLSPEGDILKIENEDAYWRSVERSSASGGRDVAADRHAAGLIAAILRQMPREDRLAAVAQLAGSLLAFSGLELTPGEWLSGLGDTLPGADGVADGEPDLKLDRVAGETAFLSLRSVSGSAEIREGLDTMLESLGLPKSKISGESLPETDIRTEGRFEVSLQTGLVDRSTETVTVRVGSGEGTLVGMTSTTFERISR